MDMTTNPSIEQLTDEANLISAKYEGMINRRWQIRATSITIWLATIATGLGQFSSTHDASAALLFVSTLIPISFIFIDARNYRWSRKLMLRERTIVKFINGEMVANSEVFPLLDLDASLSHQRGFIVDRAYYKAHSRVWKHMTHPTQLSFFGMQAIGSLLLTAIGYFQ